jgi:malate:Na+ symporter
MNRILLIQGMIRMFVPLVVGTLMAVLSGLIVGSLFGLHHITRSSSSSYRLLAVELVRGSCRCRWPIRQYWGKPLMYVAQLAPRWWKYLRHHLCRHAGASGDETSSLSGNGMLTRSKDDHSLFTSTQSVQPTDFHLMGGGC